jgi:hypothetical protein
MIWSNFDLEFATSDEYSCDLLVTDERDGVEVWRVWEAEDDEDTLVLEDGSEEAVYDFLAEQDGWEDAVWASEAERTRVKFAVKEVREETAFYLEEPPRDAYEDIGRLEALEILERRGIETDNLEDAWYWPKRNKAAFHFVSSDSHGEVYRTLREVANLDDVERGLVEGRWPDEEDSRKSIEEMQEEVYEETTWPEFEAGIIACWRRGITDYEEIAEALDTTYANVTNSVYHIRDKLEMRAREQREVYPVVPEEFRPEDLLFDG